MKKFLSTAAEKIISNGCIGSQSIVILPNHRSEVFLKEEIKKIANKSIWLPEFYTIDEFVQKASGLSKIDNISVFFELFKVQKKLAGSNAKTIDEFLTWAPVMLSDFNDIDNAMADAEDVFKQLSAIKAMQQWNPDGSPLTQLQKNYIHFFQSLLEYYNELRSNLTSSNTGYQGLISRHLAENISTLLEKRLWKNFTIVGINALPETEIRIFDFINRNFKTDFIWDVDNYYLSAKNEQKNQQEAGKHIKKVINRLKLNFPNNIEDNLSTSAKKIKIVGVPKNIGQAKFIGQEILTSNINKNHPALLNTAIILADESLLMPLLNSLPDKNMVNEAPLKYNITLGYPMSSSSIEHFFSIWIDLIISRSQNKGRIYSANLISLLSNPLVKQILENNVSELLVKHLINDNISTITLKELEDWLPITNKKTFLILSKILPNNKENSIDKTLAGLRDVFYSAISNNSKLNKLYKEQVKQLIKIISKLLWLNTQNENIINYHALKKIGHQLINLSNINLVGEPLEGIQIMGMLETRNLNFENIYILSANEGIIPKADNINSFIPMDIRSEYNLPLPSEKSEIYAYHFYRLLQQAKNISLIYNSDADKLGGGEKSRFILQIENELAKINPQIKITNTNIVTSILKEDEQKTRNRILITKDKEIQKKLIGIMETGFSPSSLSNYIACPLKFYFSNLLRLTTNNELEQTVEANTFGTVVHSVLEKTYEQFLGKEIDPEAIKNQLSTIKQLLSNEFNKYYKKGTLNSGRDLLISEVANSYIINFLKWDIKNITQQPIILQSTESKIITSINHIGTRVNFKGTIDRVDKIVTDKTIRIIDYKTGRVQPGDLKVKDTENLTTDPKYAKAFQVIFYAWLYSQQQPNEKLETGIISLRNLSNGFIPLIINGVPNINDFFTEFTASILKLVDEILNNKEPFRQTNDTTQCEWCDFKSICNR